MVLTTLRHYLSRCPVVLTESLSLSVCGTAMGHYLSLSNISLTSVCPMVLITALRYDAAVTALLHYCITALHYLLLHCGTMELTFEKLYPGNLHLAKEGVILEDSPQVSPSLPILSS